MADTADLGSVTVRCGGSSPSMPTRFNFATTKDGCDCKSLSSQSLKMTAFPRYNNIMKRVYNEFQMVDDDET